MNNVVLGLLLLFATVVGVSAQKTKEGQSETIQPVDYCTLRKDPERYNGKAIRVSGIYVSGFEISAFYSKACVDDPYRSHYETWVDNFYRATISSDQETSAIVSTFRSGKAGSELEVTLTGVFRGTKEGGGFGHMGGSKFEIEVVSIENARLLPEEVGGCRRIDPTKPFHFLSLEKVGKGIPQRYEKSEKPRRETLIYLRLGNNSTCPIRIPTVDNNDKRALEDRSEVPVIYDLTSPCVRVAGRSMTKVQQTLSVLSPGESVSFAVPLRLLTKEPYELRIPFDSGSVKDNSYYQPFYFSRYDVPKDLQKDLDCTKY